MRKSRWQATSLVAVGALGLMAATVPSVSATTAANNFTQTNLVASNSTFGAKLVDPNLTNAWGMAAAPGNPLWVSDNNSGFASVYSGGPSGVTLDLTVKVPGGNPTGQVFNSDSSAFPVGGPTGSAAAFIVDSDGIGTTPSAEIAAWNGGTKFTVEDSPSGGAGGKTPAGAIFKGLAEATSTAAGPELFAADVHNATIDIFNSKFAPVSAPAEFKDPKVPAGYAPFNVQLIGSKLYVTYGKQNKAKTDVVPGAGRGIVDVFTVNGTLVHHLVSNGSGSPLNEPWGLVIAPGSFGSFAGDLLVGNLGNGWINAFNKKTGAYAGALYSNGAPVAISGLWGLRQGSSAFGGAGSVVFSSGPGGYSNGLVGILTPAG